MYMYLYIDPTKTVLMCNVKQFLHKVTPAVMKSSGAIIPGTEEVCIYLHMKLSYGICMCTYMYVYIYMYICYTAKK